MKKITYEEQTKITRAIIKAAVLMLEFGAESKLIEETAQRLGNALGIDSVEMSLIPSAIVLSTLSNNQTQSVTTTRRAHHKPINMSIVCDVQKMCHNIEKENQDVDFIFKALKEIQPNYYNRWLVMFMVGLSCASFAYLTGGDISAFFITFIASTLAMFTRQELAKRKFVMIITFAFTAFVATIVAGLSQIYELSSTPNVILSASVILLAPGFPFVNSVLDAVKGYLAMGWGRWMQAVLLTVATSIGIILALALLSLKGW
ncbi:threonine/serine ThrE exporter family protein [Poseidonibacter ostreae]|uniref:Threonine/serine exporter n=1 Tax=Poseidonibacter ostreae TaxID=2654171 RepID=A0A6L4WWA3_9BACT|nr:threonine/serine exporter family protein [Poseidonibacter ostreae]KAB7891099.1 threonine/serine exporter [Poseidonibacter ostreae]KAB7892823.1 threonine/serine exporter [Poseidonibacter ostreae]